MKRILFLILLCFSLSAARAQMVALKTNALMDVACAPNLTLEVATSSNTSLSMQAYGMWDTWYKDFTDLKKSKVYGFAPEFRYWFGGRAFDRFFLGGGAKFVHYSMIWGDNDRNGAAVGLGLTFGYDLYLGRHFVIDFHAGMGGMQYFEHHKVRTDATGEQYLGGTTSNGFKEHGFSLIPYQIGVSFVYLIK